MIKRITLVVLSALWVSHALAAATSPSMPTATNQGTMTTTASQNQAAGDAFLAANKKQPGVVTLPDGLQYKILTQGKGPKPTEHDTVIVDYAGTFINGTEFDSSYKVGAPAHFPVNAVIPGWVEALQLMPVGSTWMLYIPSRLAYGEQGAANVIGPNQVLIFKLNLIGIKSMS